MNDRELLEKAAKAAGLGEVWSLPGSGTTYIGKRWEISNPVEYSVWNPLANDGDALRLLARLGMDIIYTPEAVEVNASQHAAQVDGETVCPWAWESLLGADPYAATRRAIESAVLRAQEGKT